MIPRFLKGGVKTVLFVGVLGISCVFLAVWSTQSTPHIIRNVQSSDPQVAVVPDVAVKSINSNSTHLHRQSPLTINHRNKSYLLALGYTEQLSAASHTMYSLGALAGDWGADIVEPFVKKSFLFGFRNVIPPDFRAVKDRESLGLFDIYKEDKVNEELGKISPELSMSAFDTFVKEAPTDVVIIHFSTKSSKKTQRLFALSGNDTHLLEQELLKAHRDNVVQCISMDLRDLHKIGKDIVNELNKRKKNLSNSSDPKTENFAVKQMWCLDPQKVYTSNTLRKYVSFPSIVIFTNWRGCGLVDCYYTDEQAENTSSRKWRDTFRYGILTKAKNTQKLILQHQLHRSSIEDSARYSLKHLDFKGPFISIHIRTERLIKLAKGSKDHSYIEKCLTDLVLTVKNLTRRSSGKSLPTLVVSDVSTEYGTSTCKKGIACKYEEAKGILTRIGKLGFRYKYYDPKELNGPENSAYVSLVEMHMLAAGDKLVMVGFGGFQGILENLFLSNGHSKQDAFHICHSL